MKKLIIILSVVLSATSLYSQKSDDIGKISLFVVMPEEYSPNFERLSMNELKKIKSKITSITSRNGVSGSGLGNFVIYPVLNIYDDEVIETGLEPQTIVRAEFSLFIQQLSTGQIYGEETIEIEGFGRNRSKAITKAIQSINTRDRGWREMINNSKQKIIDYYNLRCDDIQAEAEGQSLTKDYIGALVTLMQVPVEVSCYREITSKAVEFYDYHIELECQEKIAAAKVLKTQDKWDEAAGVLFNILPHYDCFDDAMVLLKEIEDHRCSVDLGKAKGAWARGEEGAMEAAQYLAMVPSDSKCAEEAQKLSNDIRSRLEHLDQREWDLQYEKYNREMVIREDKFEREMTMREDAQNRNLTMREDAQNRNLTMKEDAQNRNLTMKEDAQKHDQYMKEREQDTKDMAINKDGAIIESGETSIITTKVNKIRDLVASVLGKDSKDKEEKPSYTTIINK